MTSVTTYSTAFNMRLVFQVVAGLTVVGWLLSKRFPKLRVFEKRPLSLTLNSYWHRVLVASTLAFLIAALVTKITQFESLLFSGSDFWLFEDMYRWIGQGEPFVTRYSVHGAGPTQHGVVHPFLSLLFIAPLVWIFGATNVAIGFNAVALAFGGYVLGRLAFRMTESANWAVCAPLAFWMSEWTGRTLLYETHPESAYPLLIFLAVLALIRFADGVRAPTALLSAAFFWILLASAKQDALVISSLIAGWFFIDRKWSLKRTIPLLALTLICTFTMAYTVSSLKSGAIGTKQIQLAEGLVPVLIPKTASHVVGNTQISGISSLPAIFAHFVSQAGGLSKLLAQVAKYFVSGPFLMFSLLAPWIWLSRGGWILLFPIFLLFSLIGEGAGGLYNYYSAPILGLQWLAILSFQARDSERHKALRSRFALSWIVLFAAIHGANAPTFLFPNNNPDLLLTEAFQKTSNLPGYGIVSSRLLNGVDKTKVWSDRLFFNDQNEPELSDSVRWVLLPKNLPSFEWPVETTERWRDWALKSGNWEVSDTGTTELYLRK